MSNRYGDVPEMTGASHLSEQKRNRQAQLLRRGLVVAAAVAAFWVTSRLVGPDPNVLDSFPAEIIGTWQSSDPRYQDRAMVILEDEVELRLGAAGDPALYTVTELRRTDSVDFVAYQLSYSTPEGMALLELHLLPDGTARLRNPADVVWRRVPQ
ncbi:MAG: hypothetical protein OEO79_04055 [Gemmatimonadota bacterium]|nr:hypothetical protein [Gemmatimonadota bacterium]MDH3421822.1 hypothetical protein [Gemmatimonadota bacterium]